MTRHRAGWRRALPERKAEDMIEAAQVDLSGRQALITGAARGLGAALARRLAAAGAPVLVADVRKDLAQELCDDIGRSGGTARVVELDIRDAEAVATVFRDLDEERTAVDILINNAAVDVSKPIEHLSAEEVTGVVTTNLLGPMFLVLEAYRRMIARGGGHIVNVLSTAATRTWTEAGPYAASKAGLRAFTHTLFQEAQRDCPGVGVTGVIAGGMHTPFILERFPDADVSLLQSPDIVADTVLYALSVPAGSALSELVVVPRKEPSWP